MPAPATAIVPTVLGGSSNGRTTDSDSVNLGSNPGPPATDTWPDRFRRSWLVAFRRPTRGSELPKHVDDLPFASRFDEMQVIEPTVKCGPNTSGPLVTVEGEDLSLSIWRMSIKMGWRDALRCTMVR